ncbi:unnamed protein product [Adineta ricciae]|uniref:Uncharacterized protein n=1 Tax=Adineta ricciae TaxID=249248 RepID=A0A815DPI4_ADIRI|nr:unnamed protein product [Adineta ricciae]CAF1484233.1 unnamed protein product [Adineta ricciae]
MASSATVANSNAKDKSVRYDNTKIASSCQTQFFYNYSMTDNASNNIKAFGTVMIPGFEPYFEEPSSESSDERDDDGVECENKNIDEKDETCNWCDTSDTTSELLRIPCYIHTLQLMVGDGFKEISCIKAAITTKVSSIAKFSHKSTQMAERLEQNGFNIPIAVTTRWNSQYHTVVRTIEIPSRDIVILHEFATIFALIAEIFTRPQSDQTASISLVAPSLLEIYYDLGSEQASYKYTNGLCKALLKSMYNRFHGLFKQVGLSIDGIGKVYSTSEFYSDSIFFITPFLDARCGLQWVMHSNLPTELELQLCKTIKRLVASVALQLHGADRQEHNDTIAETLAIAIANNNSPGVKRKTLFIFCVYRRRHTSGTGVFYKWIRDATTQRTHV